MPQWGWWYRCAWLLLLRQRGTMSLALLLNHTGQFLAHSTMCWHHWARINYFPRRAPAAAAQCCLSSTSGMIYDSPLNVCPKGSMGTQSLGLCLWLEMICCHRLCLPLAWQPSYGPNLYSLSPLPPDQCIAGLLPPSTWCSMLSFHTPFAFLVCSPLPLCRLTSLPSSRLQQPPCP